MIPFAGLTRRKSTIMPTGLLQTDTPGDEEAGKVISMFLTHLYFFTYKISMH